MKESYQTRQGALILQTMQNLAGPVTAEALCAILREQGSARPPFTAIWSD